MERTLRRLQASVNDRPGEPPARSGARDPHRVRPTAPDAHLCIGGREHCLELLGRFAEAGCERVYLWPLGDEPRQLEIAGAELQPHLIAAGPQQ
jgi:hypothetical protein